MPYPGEHAARIVEPDKFEKDSFRRKNIADGIDIIIGKLKGETSMTTQAYRFKSDKFTAEEAKKWLKDHKIDYISFEPASESDMKNEYMNLRIENKSEDETEIFIDGTIGWDSEASWSGIKDKLINVANSKAKKLIVNINSLGGFVSDGLMIHDALKMSKADIETRVYSMTASAATLIAQAGNKRKMSSNSLYLIHHAMLGAGGNINDMKAAVDDLEKIDKRIYDIYVKNGADPEKVKTLMDENNGYGKWIDADEALEIGLIDEIIEPSKAAAIVDNEILNKYHLPQIPEQYLNKEIMENQTEEKKSLKEWFLSLGGSKNDEEITSLKAEIVLKDAKIQELEAAKNPAEVSDAANAEILAAKDTEISDLKAKLESKESELKSKETELANVKVDLDKANTQLSQLGAKSTKVPGPEGNLGGDAEEKVLFGEDIKKITKQVNTVPPKVHKSDPEHEK